MECEEKELIIKEKSFADAISQMNKEKLWLEELLTLKDNEIVSTKKEFAQM